MRFVASHTHPAAQCPLATAQGKTQIKTMFSKDNMKKAGVKLEEGYLSCPNDPSSDHKGIWIMEADKADTLTKFFGPMTVDVREVSKFSDLAKTL